MHFTSLTVIHTCQPIYIYILIFRCHPRDPRNLSGFLGTNVIEPPSRIMRRSRVRARYNTYDCLEFFSCAWEDFTRGNYAGIKFAGEVSRAPTWSLAIIILLRVLYAASAALAL